MKKQNLKLFISSLLFVFVVSISTTSIFAQSDKIMKIEVPFSFYVGNQEFSAGIYDLSRNSEGSFLVRSADGRQKVIAPTPSGYRIKQAVSAERIVFNRYGDKYFLRQIFSNRAAEGFGLSESKAEKSVRKDGLKDMVAPVKNFKPDQVSVLIKQ